MKALVTLMAFVVLMVPAIFFGQSAVIMLFFGWMHHEVWPAFPPIGFWTAVVLNCWLALIRLGPSVGKQVVESRKK